VLSLVFSYFVKPDALAGLSFYSKSAIGGVIAGVPIFFAGILFASAFQRARNTSAAFGANLLGALAGGILENLSMIYGVAFLNLLALSIYLLSIAALCKPDWFDLRLVWSRITGFRQGVGDY
jgi:hypothetical protein